MAEKQQLIKIVQELQSGNKNMAAVLYETYYRDLHYYILKRVNDPEKAEALTQDTFIEIFDTVGTLKSADEFGEWSRKIADRRCDEYKRVRRELLLGKVGTAAVDSVAEERKEIHVEQKAAEKTELPIHEVMDSLSEEQRAAVLASYGGERKDEDDKTIVPVTGIRVVFKTIEPFFRKVIVGILATVILAMIKDIGVDWGHKGTDTTIEENGTFEGTEAAEESGSCEDVEYPEEHSWVENTEGQEESWPVEEPETTEGLIYETQASETSSSVEETEVPEESSSVEIIEGPEETESYDEYLEVPTEVIKPTETIESTEAIKPTETIESTETIEPTEAVEPTQPKDEPTVSEGLEYTHVGSYYEVSGVGTCTDIVIVVPKEYNGLPVGAIGMYAFSNCNATKIILPDSIQFIEGGAFSGCKQLEDIMIPDSVISIGDSAFAGCESLTEISIPKTQAKISSQMLYGCCNLKKVVIPDGVESIGWEAFAFCYNLTSINIPASVSGIEGSAFYQCIGLTEITVDAANPVYYGVNNCVISKSSNTLRIGCSGSVIPADGSVTQIGDYAFVACGTWSSVNIPEGITKLGKNAFEEVPLKHISIPKSMISIGDRAIASGCTLETITYAGTSAEWERVEKGAGWDASAGNYEIYCIGVETLEFRNIGSGYEVAGIGSYTKKDIVIPAEYQGMPVVAIGESAFENSGLTSIVLPEGILKIETFAFMGCLNLKTIVFPDSLAEIGDYAFADCKKLSEVTFSKGLKTIGNYAFLSCWELKTVNFPEGLSCIGEAAFELSGLTKIVIPASVTTIGRRVFTGCQLESIAVETENPVYYSEGNCLISKMSKTLIRGCKNSMIPTDGSILRIGESAFCYCENFYDFIIPEGVVSIGEGAFAFCSLKSLTIPESVSEIGISAFWENRDLEIIYYGGTREAWGMLEKGTEWDGFTGGYTVYCSDGEIKK